MVLLTEESRLKMTTLPPLSPVASSSPSGLNSTQEIISATLYRKQIEFVKMVLEKK